MSVQLEGDTPGSNVSMSLSGDDEAVLSLVPEAG